MKMCIVHDLGEAVGGDIPAIEQPADGKAEQERRDLMLLLKPLPEHLHPFTRPYPHEATGRGPEVIPLWD